MLATVSLIGDTLLITDETTGGSDDNLTIHVDVFDRYVIEDPDQTMFTSISGASGDGSNLITLSSSAMVNNITFSTAGGDDSILIDNVLGDVLAGDLTVLGGAGSDIVDIQADIEFAANANLNVDLTNGALIDDADQISMSTSANLVFSGSGSAKLFANANVSLVGGTATIDVVDGDIDIRGNEGRVNFHSADTGQSIDNDNATISDLVIAESDTITDLNVTLDIDHTNTADLDVFLIHPDGTRVELFTDVGGSGNHFGNTSLDDEAFSSIAGSIAPHTGVFRPEGDLSVFDGKSINGNWQLEITDDSFFNDGVLNAWSVNVLTDNPVSFVGETGGVSIAFSDFTSTGTGDINVFGRGGNGTGPTLHGIDLRTADFFSTSLATDAGTVTLEGVGGTGTRNNFGISYSQGRLEAEAGDVFIRGEGGGQTNQNWGVFLLNMNVRTAGDATVVGVAGEGTQAHGYSAGQASIRAEGATTVTGTGNANNAGIDVFSSSSIIEGDTELILEADDIGLGGGFVPDSDGLITFRPLTPGYEIDLGSNPAGVLGLADSEIDTIFLSESVQIGDAISGDIVISDRISTRHNMSLVTSGSITFNDQIVLTSEKWLNLNAGLGVFPTFNGVDVSIGEETLGFETGTDVNIAIDGSTADTEYAQLNVVGQVDLSGADLITSGSYSPVSGEEFVIVSNDGSDPIVGTFNGVPEGHRFDDFLGSDFDGVASYVGGDGNDFVISVVAETKVTSVVLGDGTAQRSRVERLQVTFNSLVDFTNDDPLSALSMFRVGDGSAVDLVLDSIDESGGTTVLNLVFTGAMTRGGGALLDGNYELNVIGTNYTRFGTSVAGEDFSIGDNAGGDDKFYSLFGDGNGDRTVNVFDLLLFRSVFNDPDNYSRLFDYSDDGAINIFDLLQFRSRYRSSI